MVDGKEVFILFLRAQIPLPIGGHLLNLGRLLFCQAYAKLFGPLAEHGERKRVVQRIQLDGFGRLRGFRVAHVLPIAAVIPGNAVAEGKKNIAV